jgi:phospholipase C
MHVRFYAPRTEGTQMVDIRHIVVLMMENRSFDHMLGYLRNAGMDVDGLTGQSNETDDGTRVTGYHLDNTRVRIDPRHSVKRVAIQVNDGKMDGFVKGYGASAPVAEIMSWYDERELTTYDRLARQYAVCDRWFSPVPGPTWPNRFYAMCGTSDRISKNLERINHSTFFDLLPAGSWRYYSHDVAFLRSVEKYTGQRGVPIEKVSSFYNACRDGTLPSVSWIDPNFTVVGVDALLNWANDDHPPADVARGQNLVARIYNYLITSKAWPHTLFIVTYDEHGGFYDHVAPPPSPANELAPFDRYGVRVPALLISPWAARGVPFHGTVDHTCIARTALELFAPTQVTKLSPRVTASQSLLSHLTEPAPRQDATRLDGIPIVEVAIAPIHFGPEARAGFHSMVFTDNQNEMEELKKWAHSSGVPNDLH